MIGNLNDVDISVLIDFAKKYNDLGGSIQEQLVDLLDRNFEGLNPNAVFHMESLGRFHEDIKFAIKEYHEWLKKAEVDDE